jgi:hypothetical protein
MTIHRALLALLLAGAAPAASASHAVQFDLDVDPARAGAWRIDLPLAVYREAAYTDLRDVEARNGRDEPVPLGPVPLRWGAPAAPVLREIALSPFALPRLDTALPIGERIRLQVEQDPSGALRRLDLTSGAASAVTTVSDLLLDTGDGNDLRIALDVALDPAAGPALRAQVQVLASADLDVWRAVGAPQALLRLEQGGRVLERRQLDLGALRDRYLLLRRIDGDGRLPVASVGLRLRAQPDRLVDWPQSQVVEATFERGGEPGEFFYRAPGPIPVDAIEVLPADLNTVAEVQLDSRDRADREWTPRHAGTAFRVAFEGSETSSLPARIDAVREREWRITTEPPLAQPPLLRLGWTPDAWVLLAQGPGPFRLVAGSADSQRPNWPLERALDALALQSGPDFAPPKASVGPAVVRDGDAARQPTPPPLPWRRIALWGVLVLGALAVVALVLRLLRERPAT